MLLLHPILVWVTRAAWFFVAAILLDVQTSISDPDGEGLCRRALLGT